jgi:hypothetical protein
MRFPNTMHDLSQQQQHGEIPIVSGIRTAGHKQGSNALTGKLVSN